MSRFFVDPQSIIHFSILEPSKAVVNIDESFQNYIVNRITTAK